MVEEKAVGEKGSKERHLLDSLWASPAPAETMVGSRASWGQGRTWFPILSTSSRGAGADGIVSLLHLG